MLSVAYLGTTYLEDASFETSWNADGNVCALTYSRLDVSGIISAVGDDTAGATAVFIGTTRNSFAGKTVARLEYQAYSKLAIKTMADIMKAACQLVSRSDDQPENQAVPSLIRCAVHHRLGTVPVGEPSIVIAVSSPHRKEAFVACEFLLEEIKSKAQIWKREFYEGEDDRNAEWKSNK
ncbi:hypothetical protein HGRIS_007974 [Hohenbuehelia grisea]|uniref:Molybdopterin synthase catalytic subunit n=1 Tax=Hohenbuehelia grisea TaxID=104357 RepID=A0ABR3J6I1_9AGAR